MLTDVVSLVGLNAPHLFQFGLQSQSPAYIGYNPNSNDDEQDEVNALDDIPKLSEPVSLKRMAYENQWKRNFNEDNSLEENTEPNIQATDSSLINLSSSGSSDKETTELTSSKSKDELKASTNRPATVISDDQEVKNESESNGSTKVNDVEQNDEPIDKGKDVNKKQDKETTEIQKSTTKESTDKDLKDDGKKDSKGKKMTDDKTNEKTNEKLESTEHPTTSEAVREQSDVLKRSWNYFLDGLYSNDNKLVLNIFILVKLLFRLLTLITLPLLIIGNQKSRASYIKPFKAILLLQFLFCLACTIYYSIVSTQCDYYKNIKEWFPKHFEEPDKKTGLKISQLYLLFTFADLFPYFCIISLVLINRREKQITRKKDESSQENWDMQLRPIGIPRIKSTNSEHISPLNLHFNQPNSNHHDNLPLTAGLITNEEISINNQPFSYTSNNNNQSSSPGTLPCYDQGVDNHGFNKN